MSSERARPPAQKRSEKGKEKLVVLFYFVNLIHAALSRKRDFSWGTAFYLIGLWVCHTAFSWLMWAGPSQGGMCHPWAGGHGVYKVTNWESLWKASLKGFLLGGLCFGSCPVYPSKWTINYKLKWSFSFLLCFSFYTVTENKVWCWGERRTREEKSHKTKIEKDARGGDFGLWIFMLMT